MLASAHAFLCAAPLVTWVSPPAPLTSNACAVVSLWLVPHSVRFAASRLPIRSRSTKSSPAIFSSTPTPSRPHPDINRSRPTMPETHAPQQRKISFQNAFRNPAKLRTDILMSIRPEHMSNIAAGRKNHEYRKYLLPSSVKRIWFYTSTPVSSFQFVAQVGPCRKPGEVPEDGGLGNDDFNAGRKVSKYGYEIQKLWRLRKDISLAVARSKGYLKGPPQKYNWAPPRLIQECPLEKQDCVLNRAQKKRSAQKDDSSTIVEQRPKKKMKSANQGQE